MIAALTAVLKPEKFNEDQYLYVEGQNANCIYFCFKGIAAFVYENSIKDNIVFCTIETGDFLDMIDFVPSKQDIQKGVISEPKWKFTVLALSNETEFLSLSIDNLEEIKNDF